MICKTKKTPIEYLFDTQ